jgi:hypothetical protein
MKNAIFLFLSAFGFTAAVNAQTTVDSIRAKYTLLPMPEALTLEKAFPAIGTYHLGTTAEVVASDSGSVNNVVITLDSANKGMIWVEGLPEGKFKAYLKQSPASYRILAQKTDKGTQIPEGTLVVDSSTKMLQIALGKAFDEANPTEVFALNPQNFADQAVAGTTEVKVKTETDKKKSKIKLVFYTAVKQDQSITSVNTQQANQQFDQKLQQQQQLQNQQ